MRLEGVHHERERPRLRGELERGGGGRVDARRPGAGLVLPIAPAGRQEPPHALFDVRLAQLGTSQWRTSRLDTVDKGAVRPS